MFFPSDAETSRITDLISGQPANKKDRTLLLQRMLHVLWMTFNAPESLKMTAIACMKQYHFCIAWLNSLQRSYLLLLKD